MKTLFLTEDDFKDLIEVSVGLKLSNLSPYLTKSQGEDELIRIMGETLYQTLVDKVNDNTIGDPGNEAWAALLPYARKPLINMAVLEWSRLGGMTISSGGMTLSTDREKQAYQWQRIELQDKLQVDASLGLEKLFQFLDKNKDDYPDWVASDQFAELKGHFITTAKDFQRWVNIGSSRRMLSVLEPIITAVEQMDIRNILGDTLFEALLDGIFNDTLSADQEKLLGKIQPVIAHRAIVRAVDDLSLTITPEGMFLYTITASGASQVRKKGAAELERLEKYKAMHRESADNWSEVLRRYLNSNASLFPGFEEEGAYEDPDTSTQTYDNSDTSNSIWNGL